MSTFTIVCGIIGLIQLYLIVGYVIGLVYFRIMLWVEGQESVDGVEIPFEMFIVIWPVVLVAELLMWIVYLLYCVFDTVTRPIKPTVYKMHIGLDTIVDRMLLLFKVKKHVPTSHS